MGVEEGLSAKMQIKKMAKKVLIIICWLVIWQMLAAAINNPILIVGPIETIKTLIRLLPDPVFRRAVYGTTVMVLSGFLVGWLAGMICAGIAYRYRPVREFLEPVIAVFRAVPIVSFVILLLIWQGSGRLSFLIGFLVVFVVMYGNVLNGLLGMNDDLVQEAKLLHVSLYRRVRYIYLPEIYPEMKSGLELSIGMAFKSGIAAEIIGQPADTIGNALYRSKIFLETDGVLAYTLTAVCVAWVAEKLIVLAWDGVFRPKTFEKNSSDKTV